MKSKENIRCFKWYKDDRVCDICPYDKECKYEFEYYHFIDNYKYTCEHLNRLKSTLSLRSCTKFNIFCDDEEVKKCFKKEINNWKRKYKLDNLNK